MSIKRIRKFGFYSAMFMITAFSMILVCYLRGIVPFGNRASLAVVDAKIQYLDFFAYLKDVLSGTQKIGYSFNRTLGGNNIAVFSYYLASPFNLLVMFFRKDQLQAFFTVAVILKMSVASVTSGIFLKNRFEKLESVIAAMLSLGYGMMQYSIAQASNIMWLDGVYMLPLVLLGVSKLVRENKKAFLMGAAGIALLFNWYAAAIDFLFSAIWFLYETVLITPIERENIKKMAEKVVRYCISMAVGLMIGAALFLPSVLAMADGKGKINWGPALGIYGWANIFSFIQKLELGTGTSNEYGSVSLYCGSLAVIGCVICIIWKKLEKEERRKRTLQLGFLALVLSLFYIPVFIWVFSLLKYVGSYWYRYGYVGCMALITVAADIFSDRAEKELSLKIMWKAAVAVVLILFFMEYVKPLAKPFNLYMTALAFLSTAFFLSVYISSKRKLVKMGLAACLLFTVSAELIYNGKLTAVVDEEIGHFVQYTNEESELINQVKAMDPDFYRIQQTSTRDTDNDKLTANYNEGLAYDYHSISSYTSDPDLNQLEFMDRMGYKLAGDVMGIANTSILGADSLLGVKYVLSSYDIPGLEKVESIAPGNGKYVYYNPYALPFAFTYTSTESRPDAEEKNAFLYQNQVYSYLAGRNVEINKKIETKPQAAENTVSYGVEYKNDPVYGSIRMKDEKAGKIYVDDQFITTYNTWLSPDVFYVPKPSEADYSHVQIDGDKMENSVEEADFYYTDLKQLKTVVQEIKNSEAKGLLIKDGFISGTVDNASNKERLYLSVPYDKGWSILVNGKKVRPEVIGDCMMSLPLEPGKNEIEMKYRIPGMYAGIGISVVGVAVLAVVYWKERKKVIC